MSEIMIRGKCCACGKVKVVRNIVCLPKWAPMKGTGWGGLPANSAVAVVCDECMESQERIRWAVKGWASDGERVSVDELVGRHQHDMRFHSRKVLVH